MRKFRLPALLFSALAFGCANISEVYPVGAGRYHLSTRATWEYGGRLGATEMALKKATAFCSEQGKSLRVIRSASSYGHFEGGEVEILFTCE